MVDEYLRDWVLGKLEDCGVDDRVGEEVIPAPTEHGLDRNRQVRVRDVEEWAWVIDPLVEPIAHTPTRLRESSATTSATHHQRPR